MGAIGFIGCVTLSVSQQDDQVSRHQMNIDSNLFAQSRKCAEAYSQSGLHQACWARLSGPYGLQGCMTCNYDQVNLLMTVVLSYSFCYVHIYCLFSS